MARPPGGNNSSEDSKKWSSGATLSTCAIMISEASKVAMAFYASSISKTTHTTVALANTVNTTCDLMLRGVDVACVA